MPPGGCEHCSCLQVLAHRAELAKVTFERDIARDSYIKLFAQYEDLEKAFTEYRATVESRDS